MRNVGGHLKFIANRTFEMINTNQDFEVFDNLSTRLRVGERKKQYKNTRNERDRIHQQAIDAFDADSTRFWKQDRRAVQVGSKNVKTTLNQDELASADQQLKTDVSELKRYKKVVKEAEKAEQEPDKEVLEEIKVLQTSISANKASLNHTTSVKRLKKQAAIKKQYYNELRRETREKEISRARDKQFDEEFKADRNLEQEKREILTQLKDLPVGSKKIKYLNAELRSIEARLLGYDSLPAFDKSDNKARKIKVDKVKPKHNQIAIRPGKNNKYQTPEEFDAAQREQQIRDEFTPLEQKIPEVLEEGNFTLGRLHRARKAVKLEDESRKEEQKSQKEFRHAANNFRHAVTAMHRANRRYTRDNSELNLQALQSAEALVEETKSVMESKRTQKPILPESELTINVESKTYQPDDMNSDEEFSDVPLSERLFFDWRNIRDFVQQQEAEQDVAEPSDLESNDDQFTDRNLSSDEDMPPLVELTRRVAHDAWHARHREYDSDELKGSDTEDQRSDAELSELDDNEEFDRETRPVVPTTPFRRTRPSEFFDGFDRNHTPRFRVRTHAEWVANRTQIINDAELHADIMPEAVTVDNLTHCPSCKFQMKENRCMFCVEEKVIIEDVNEEDDVIDISRESIYEREDRMFKANLEAMAEDGRSFLGHKVPFMEIKQEDRAFLEKLSRLDDALDIVNPFGKHTPFTDKLGSLLVMMVQIYWSRSAAETWAILYQFARARRAITPDAWYLSNGSIFKDFYLSYITMKDNIERAKGNIRPESWSSQIDDLKGSLSQVMSSDMVKVFRDMFVQVVSYELFSKEFAQKAYAFLGKPEKMSFIDTINLCLDCLATVARAAEAVMADVPITSVLFAKNPVSECVSKSNQLIYFKDKLYLGKPVEGKMCVREFNRQATDLLKTCEHLLKVTNPFVTPTKELDRIRNVLKNAIYDAANASFRNKMRVPPVGVIIAGPPGIGKSEILNHVAKVYSRNRGVEYDSSHVFHRTINSDYWDNYDPISQPIIHLSEIGAKHPNLVGSQGDTAITELTSLVDSQPFVVNSAAVDLKGVVYATPDVVLGDTNKWDLGLDQLVVNKAAYLRRFIFIVPHVKPQYRKAGYETMDAFLSLSDTTTNVMDRWTFDVFRCVPKGNVEYDIVPILSGQEGDDIYKLSKFLDGVFSDHLKQQQAFTKRLDDEANIDDFFNSKNISPESAPLLAQVQQPEGFTLDACTTYALGVFRLLGWYLLLLLLDTYVGMWNFRNVTQFDNIVIILIFIIFCKLFNFSDVIKILIVLSAARPYVQHFARNYMREYLQRTVAQKVITWKQQFLSYTSGVIENNLSPFYSKHKKTLSTVCVAVATLLASAAFGFTAGVVVETLKPEATSDFQSQSSANQKLNELEEELGCSNSYARIQVKNSQVWNSIEKPVVAPVHKGDVLSLSELAMRNSRYCSVRHGNSWERSYLLGIQGDLALINTHVLGTNETVEIRVSLDGTGDNTTRWHTSYITSRTRQDLGNDTTLVQIRGVHFKNLTKHLGTVSSYPDAMNVKLGLKSLRGHYKTAPRTSIGKYNGEFIMDSYFEYIFPEHAVGMCGLPLVGDYAGGRALIGFHMGGRDDSGFAAAFDKVIIQTAINKITETSPYMPITSESVDLLGFATEPPLPKSALNYEDLRGLRYLGKEPGMVNAKQKSKLVSTGLEQTVANAIYDVLGVAVTKSFGRPVMQATVINGTYVSPYNNALRALNAPKMSLDPDVMNVVIKRYVKHIMDHLKAKGVTKVAPLTIETAINGAKGDAYLRRINARTAAGMGYGGKKSDHLPIVLERDDYLIREPTDALKQDLLTELLKDEDDTIPSYYTGTLKDEPRSFDKIKTGKTRMFYASNVKNLILARMMLAPFFTLMVEHGEAFCTAVGINMHAGSHNFITELENFSPLLMEGDYKEYDTSQPPDVHLAEATIIYEVLRLLGYSPKALQTTRRILTGELYPVLSILRDLFVALSIQPSGKYGTAEGNSLVGVILMMYCWYSQPETRDRDFFEFVLPRTYGDDVLSSVKPDVAEEFNNLTYQSFCKTNYNMEYTSATKSATIEKFMDIDTCSFLKRTFKYDTELQRYTAPLEISSLVKSLSWFISSGLVSDSERMTSTYTSFLWELSLWATMDQFEAIRAILDPIIAEKYFNNEIPTLPSWLEIRSAMYGVGDLTWHEE